MKFTVTAEIEASTAAEAISKLVNGAPTSAPVKAEIAKDSATPTKTATVKAETAKDPAAPSKPAPAVVESSGMTLTEVRSVLTPLMTGANVPLKPVITALINTYAGQLSAVDPKSFPELVAKAKALGEEFDNTGVVPSLS